SITFNSSEIAENLNKQGGFIEGVRGGKQTEKYLSRSVNKLTLFGAIALGVLALLPIIAQAFIAENIAIGGTGILILVAVALQTLRAVESRALMITYDQYSQPDFFYEPEAPADGAGDGDDPKENPRLIRRILPQKLRRKDKRKNLSKKTLVKQR
ncbi:MAG: hypothetical protein ACREHG_10895, partial [Candidatus Saccharimonadales bacterium]